MSRAIGTLCTLIICLQILVGVPILVCLGFLFLVGDLGPVAIEVHTGHDHSGLVAPPAYSVPAPGPIAMGPRPNIIPHPIVVSPDNPILASRADHGSLLAGTVLSDAVSPDAEQQLFVAALEKVAAEQAECTRPSNDTLAATACADGPRLEVAVSAPRACDNMDTAHLREDAAQSAICHLYVMAEVDERAGEYARADQWRALARELKSAGHCIETATLPLGDSSPGSSPSPDLAR